MILVKILISLAGILAAGFFFLIGIPNRSRSYVKTGWVVFLVTIGIIAAVTAIELLLFSDQ